MSRLPDEYQEVEYIQYTPSKTYCIGGFPSQEDAKKRMLELQKTCPSTSYDIGVEVEQKTKNYLIVIPEEALAFLSEDEKSLAFLQPPLQCFEYAPTVYRFIPEEYVEKFFKTGNLKITTFSCCQKLESQTRRDAEEGKGTAIGIEGKLKCEIETGVGENALMLCTSLSGCNILPDGTQYTAAIKINNINEFVDAVTAALIKNGYSVATVLKGPCIYNDRKIQREISNQALSELTGEMQSGSSFDFGKLFELQSMICSNDLYFSKPIEKSIENEYRILWMINEKVEECVYVDVPEARRFCEKICFGGK